MGAQPALAPKLTRSKALHIRDIRILLFFFDRLRFLDPCQGYRGAARLRELKLRGARLGARGDSLLPRGGAGDHCTILAGENDRELFEGALLLLARLPTEAALLVTERANP